MRSDSKASILIVEDKFIVAEDLANTLRKLGYEVLDTIMSGEEAIERAGILRPDLVMMDIHLKGAIDGIDAAQQLKDRFGISVIYLTAHSDDGTLHRASATEPLGYLLKPYEERQLYSTVEMALNRKRVEKRSMPGSHPSAAASNTRESRIAIPEFESIVGSHPALLALLTRVELVAKTDVAVHIFGENGTGKELVADAVHRLSARHAKRFVKLNCSAIPSTLLESALFGHIKGSFTGASRDQEGFVEHAEGGTLFLDEIGDISHEIQVKLLRLLQTREFTRIGTTTTLKADIRIITATNRDLKELVRSGKIREDFFYRIHVFPLNVPALRDRQSDIPLLANHFRRLFNQSFGKHLEEITSPAIDALLAHRWPGNIRELENAIRHAFVIAPDNGPIDIAHLPPDVLESSRVSNAEGASGTGESASPEEREKAEILKALAESRGSKTQAAKLLGYSRVTLWKKMSKLGLTASDDDTAEERKS